MMVAACLTRRLAWLKKVWQTLYKKGIQAFVHPIDFQFIHDFAKRKITPDAKKDTVKIT